MPRIQFQPASRTLSLATELAIYTAHINEGGHLDNVQLLTLVSPEAGARALAALARLQPAR